MGYLADVYMGNKRYPVGSSLYGTCTTSADVTEKIVTDVVGFNKICPGVTVHIKMLFENTAEKPLLNICDTGALPIYMYGKEAPVNGTSWAAGSVVSFTYDGSSWQMNDVNALGEIKNRLDTIDQIIGTMTDPIDKKIEQIDLDIKDIDSRITEIAGLFESLTEEDIDACFVNS